MDRRSQQEEPPATSMRTACSDAGPRVGRPSLEGSGPAFHSDVLPDLSRHDGQLELEALMSPAQRKATHAEPHSSAAQQLAAATVIEDAAAAAEENALPASLLELRNPSQLCCWANGCYPLPPVIPIFQHSQDNPCTNIAVQMSENAHKRLQVVAGVDGKRVQLRMIAVQSTKVILDEEAEQPPGGKALCLMDSWQTPRPFVITRISLPTSELRTGVVYVYLLAKAGATSAGTQQLNLFASLPMLALPPGIGAELEDLFGTMIQEMRSRDEAGENSSASGSAGVGEGCSDEVSEGGSSADSGRRARLKRCLSAPVVSIHRSRAPRAPSTERGSRWRDRGQGRSMQRGSTFSDNIRAGAGDVEGSSAKLSSPSSSQDSLPSPQRRSSLDAKLAHMIGSSISGLSPLPGFLGEGQQAYPGVLQVSGNQSGPASQSAPLSPNLPASQLLPRGLPNMHGILPDDVAETLSTQLASLTTMEIPRSSCTFFRSAASACSLALSLLSNQSPSVRTFAKSVHDGFSSYAGLIAASKRMHVYASSPPLVAATFSTHFGPLSADLGYVLETAERCVAFRAQSMGDQASPAGVLNSMGVDILLLAETIEDMSHLFNDQGTILCSALVRQAAEKLEGTAM